MSKKFSKRGKVEDIILEDENGVETKYTIREFSETARETFIDDQMKKAEYTPKGELVRVIDHKGIRTRLLAECLFDAKGTLVPEAEIAGWPDSLVGGLYDIATVVCNLVKDEEMETNPKKD